MNWRILSVRSMVSRCDSVINSAFWNSLFKVSLASLDFVSARTLSFP